ncbi:amidohydrolase family protein [Rhodoplanes sp. Z2-YC6860]|uniref:amidohydrolase family protein n=1 Tax=Rhodoplanes sp. Z2-YC6860 TaxID=674703 RepID=UPI0018DB75F6|nr:amidohydrolase family protein [Rhodoplanes sp. Z2-YC6860]
MHVYDGVRFAPSRPAARMQPDSTAADYRLLQQRLGTNRTVVVQPAAYGIDNGVTLDAIERLGRSDTRGVAVVHPDVTEIELKRLDAGGIRGIRFPQFDPQTAATTRDMIEPLAKRVEPLGWHVQIHLRSDQIADAADLLQRLPGTVVFDHLGRLAGGVNDPALMVIRRMLDRGRTWIKLSGGYFFGDAPAYAGALPVARTYVTAAPERVVWGSDWPHPTEADKPDDATLLDLLLDWAPDDAIRRRVLVDNPAALYGFSP